MQNLENHEEPTLSEIILNLSEEVNTALAGVRYHAEFNDWKEVELQAKRAMHILQIVAFKAATERLIGNK